MFMNSYCLCWLEGTFEDLGGDSGFQRYMYTLFCSTGYHYFLIKQTYGSTVVPATSGHLLFGAKLAPRGRWPPDTGTLTRQRQYLVGTLQKWPAKAGCSSPKGLAVAGTTVLCPMRFSRVIHHVFHVKKIQLTTRFVLLCELMRQPLSGSNYSIIGDW